MGKSLKVLLVNHPMFSFLASNKSSTVLVISTFQLICFFFFTGSIIRCMRRLEELLRQMCQAAKAIGNTELENKFAEGQYPVCKLFLIIKAIF